MKPTALALPLLLLLAACSGPAVNPHAQNSFLTADDLVTMTDNMAASIAADPQVAALTAKGPISIVLMPIGNETNEMIPQNEKLMYVHRIRALLAEKQVLRSKFTFVLNRSDYQKLLAQEGASSADLGPSPDRIVPEYALTGTFWADTKASSQHRSDFYLCTYRLTRINPNAASTALGAASTGEIIWEGKYETKKTITRGMLD